MRKGITEVTSLFILTLVAISSIIGIYLMSNKIIQESKTGNIQEFIKEVQEMGYKPFISKIYDTNNDEDIIVRLEYYGSMPIPMNYLYYQLIYTNGTKITKKFREIIDPNACFDDIIGGNLAPGAKCDFILNLTELGLTKKDSFFIAPVLKTNIDEKPFLLGYGKNSLSMYKNKMREKINDVHFLRYVDDQEKPVKIDNFGYKTCVITNSSTLFCWGYNLYGQLGIGCTSCVDNPVIVPFFWDKKIKKVEVGYKNVCGLTIDNKLYCWGNNDNCQIGICDFNNKEEPVQILTDKKIVDFAIDKTNRDYYSLCAVDDEGYVYCWGNNLYKMGLNNYIINLGGEQPTKIENILNIKKIKFSEDETCGLSNNEVICWKTLTNGNFSKEIIETDFNNIVDFIKTKNETCILLNNGSIYCKGILTCDNYNNYTYFKELSIGNVAKIDFSYNPYFGNDITILTKDGKAYHCNGTLSLIPEFSSFNLIDISTYNFNEYSRCGVLENGTVACYGISGFNDIKKQESVCKFRELKPLENKDIKDFVTLTFSYIYLDSENKLHRLLFSNLSNDQIILDNVEKIEPVTTDQITDMIKIHLLNKSSYLGVDDYPDFKLTYVGDNISTFGETYLLYNNHTLNLTTYHLFIENVSDVVEVAPENTVCWIKEGDIYCIGKNAYNLILNAPSEVTEPYKITTDYNFGNEKFKKIVGATGFICGLTENNTVYCWGSNTYFQLGKVDNLPTSENYRTKITELENPSSNNEKIAFMNYENYTKSFGIVTGPYSVSIKNVSDIYAAATYACAKTYDNETYCWGNNGFGQFGVGTLELCRGIVNIGKIDNFKIQGANTIYLEDDKVYLAGYDIVNIYSEYITLSLQPIKPLYFTPIKDFKIKINDLCEKYPKDMREYAVVDHAKIDNFEPYYLADAENVGGFTLNKNKTYYAVYSNGKITKILLPGYISTINVNKIITRPWVAFAISNGKTYYFGKNKKYILGDNSTQSKFVNRFELHPFLSNFIVKDIKITSDNSFACAIIENNSLLCWGYDPYKILFENDVYVKLPKIPKEIYYSNISKISTNKDYTGEIEICEILNNDSKTMYCFINSTIYRFKNHETGEIIQNNVIQVNISNIAVEKITANLILDKYGNVYFYGPADFGNDTYKDYITQPIKIASNAIDILGYPMIVYKDKIMKYSGEKLNFEEIPKFWMGEIKNAAFIKDYYQKLCVINDKKLVYCTNIQENEVV